MSDNRTRDLVLAPNEFAFISDQTKGNINVYVGPYKSSLANTDQPVFFNSRSKRFDACNLERATALFATAPEGWYVVLKNPPKDQEPPKRGTVNGLVHLDVGHKINIPGPISFALWPGQMVRIVQGHHLRSNQYLVVRVYDETSAREHWTQTIVRPRASEAEDVVVSEVDLPDLTMGKQLVIKGTEVSFYVPPTGAEVVRDEGGNYVREAVTLERLEYCILLDEDGNKRFIEGPAVVIPEPTEDFVLREGRRKFKAIELNESSGLYVKVIAPYTDKEGTSHKMGEELFITGKEQMIYFPRPEHAIIKYGQREIHYAVAIPAGEGRYSLERLTGKIRLIKGPEMYLPDPRKEVIVRRVLSPSHVSLWFPGNAEALAYNKNLRKLQQENVAQGYVRSQDVLRQKAKEKAKKPAQIAQAQQQEGFAGDDFTRQSTYTPPRTITLDTRYDGAVTISVWTGYAILVVSRSGQRKVVVGPTTHLLAYDESLEPVELSTGTPKNDDALLKTVYLRVLHNKVSDVVYAETRDLAQVTLNLSYRVNFEGEPEKWFNVENYVKFLCDHMRSMLRNAIKRMGVQEFYANSIDIVRDAVLGKHAEEGGRSGRLFPENGMRIYDVEILDVTLGDENIEKLLLEAQHNVVNQTLEIANQERRLEFVTRSEEIRRQLLNQKAETETLERELETEAIARKLKVTLADLKARHEATSQGLDGERSEQEARAEIHQAELARKRAAQEQDLYLQKARLEQQIAHLEAEVQAVVNKAEAISPDLVAALQSFSDRALTERVAESMAPLAILGGKSVTQILGQLLEGSALDTTPKKK